MRGLFFDLYGTLLIYGDMKAAWSDWLDAFHGGLRRHGYGHSREALSRHCEGFFSEKEPAQKDDGLTVLERRIARLAVRLNLLLDSSALGEVADAIVEAWQKHITLDPETVPLLRALQPRFDLVLISNFDHPPFVHGLMTSYDLKRYFNLILVSGEERTKKPEALIFERALQRLGLGPHEVMHIGDSRDDVLGARAAAIRPVLIRRDEDESRGEEHDFGTEPPQDRVLASDTRMTNAVRIRRLSEVLDIVSSAV